jgi:hypothetical protein
VAFRRTDHPSKESYQPSAMFRIHTELNKPERLIRQSSGGSSSSSSCSANDSSSGSSSSSSSSSSRNRSGMSVWIRFRV